MDKKHEFIKQISIKKLKKITPEKFADLMESSFLLYLNIDVWAINDKAQFYILRDKLLANKTFKKKAKKHYKILASYSGYYYEFLSFNKNTADISIQQKKSVIKYQEEFNKICDFCSNKKMADVFYHLFTFSKEKNDLIELDVRATIIGVKLKNERLRYYADKNGILKFSKLDLEPINLEQVSQEDLESCFNYINMVDNFFETHKLEISIVANNEIEYIYHRTFGFGRILSRDDSTVSVLFDDVSEKKLLQIGHPSYKIINKDYYNNKIITKEEQNKASNVNNDNTKPILKRIVWDKYETALLIEAFWKIENKQASRNEVITKLSQDLKKKAINQDIKIDATFRNENGISMQLSNIAKAFFPDRPAMHRTAIFDEIAEIYITDRKQFNKLLEEAHDIVDGNAKKDETKKVDWADLGNMSFTSPICVIYNGDKRSGFNSWAECFKCVLELFYKNFPEVFLDLAKNPSYTFLSRNKTDLRRPLEIAERIYAEGNRNATELVRSIKTFINKCDLKYSDIEIEYADVKSINAGVSSEKSENKYVVAISEADFYTFIKQRYIDNHKIDGKAHRAPHHAQKCVDMIRAIGKLLNINIFDLTKVSELSDVILKLNAHKDAPDYTWYMYALEKYKDFISNNPIVQSNNQSICIPNETIDVGDYKTVLSDSFVDGFSFENPLRKKKFVHRYEELLNRQFTDSDELYLKKIAKVGFISEGKVYLESVVPIKLKDEIKAFIDNSLSKTSAIYYSSLYETFNDRFNSLFSEDMLKNYLMFVFSSNYSFSSEYMTYVGAQVDLRKELIDVFMNCGRPLDIEEIYASMPNISHSVIDGILHDKDFVVNYRGKSYFYKDVFVIEDEQLEQVDEFLSKQLVTKEQITGSELYSFILSVLYDILDSNPGVTDLGIKNILKLKLEHKYNFRGDVISKLGQAIDVKTLYRDFCNQRERFSFLDLEEFRNSINQNYINWDAVMSSSIRISQSSFIRRDLVTFNEEQIDNAVASYCPKIYASFVDVINYNEFPTIEVNWNAFVLESYLYMNSKKFKLVHSTFNGDKPVGAIVNKNSNIGSFDDLLVAIIKDKQLFEEEKAFAYLLENDYIRTRKVKNISSLIDRAKKEG